MRRRPPPRAARWADPPGRPTGGPRRRRLRAGRGPQPCPASRAPSRGRPRPPPGAPRAPSGPSPATARRRRARVAAVECPEGRQRVAHALGGDQAPGVDDEQVRGTHAQPRPVVDGGAVPAAGLDAIGQHHRVGHAALRAEVVALRRRRPPRSGRPGAAPSRRQPGRRAPVSASAAPASESHRSRAVLDVQQRPPHAPRQRGGQPRRREEPGVADHHVRRGRAAGVATA